jgi:hypothetical protein
MHGESEPLLNRNPKIVLISNFIKNRGEGVSARIAVKLRTFHSLLLLLFQLSLLKKEGGEQTQFHIILISSPD